MSVVAQKGEERSSYDLGWSDGYAEGYGCKLSDATEPFAPRSLNKAKAIEAVAARLVSHYGIERSEAIGAARGMFRIAREIAGEPERPSLWRRLADALLSKRTEGGER